MKRLTNILPREHLADHELPLSPHRRSVPTDAMDFYRIDEDTPLMHMPASPKSDTELSPSFGSSSGAGGSFGNSARSTQTELQLSVDKVSFIYSPKASAHPDDGYSTFHSPMTAGSHDDELSILDPYFDVTSSRLRVAYDDANPDGAPVLRVLLNHAMRGAR